MPVTYLDSSALVRVIAREGEIEAVEQALSEEPVSSTLAKVEVSAAIYVRWRSQEISEEDRDRLLANAENNVLPGIDMFALNDEVVDEARMLVGRHPLRSLDALHVATAEIISRRVERRGDVVTFCTADKRQATTAEALFGTDRVVFVPPWR
jgi:predicted nucleic acid-binding protein